MELLLCSKIRCEGF